MAEYKVIPLADHRTLGAAPIPPPSALSAGALDGPLLDSLGRPLRDLRISVTDRCNFRCSYCMPKEVFGPRHAFLPHDQLLSFEEITRTARAFVALGVQKIRLTGGEPLLRKNLEHLVSLLAALRTPQGQPLDLTLTTNASLLTRKARALKDAGLQRITVSLDALDDAVFRRMNDAGHPVAEVLAGLAEAERVGLGPIKVNMVVKRGVNDDQILPMARHFRGTGAVLRFIEYMDVGETNRWRLDEVVPSDELISRLNAEFPLEALPMSQPGETAARWRYRDGGGEVGVISSVTQAFCGDCNRARLSTEGRLFLCLFASRGHDLRSLLRSSPEPDVSTSGDGDDALIRAIAGLWQKRDDRYSQLRGSAEPGAEPRIEMHYIGG